MTGRPSNPFVGLAFGQDPLDDPLVVGWDAVLGQAADVPPSVEADDVDLLRRFHAINDVPLPSPGFFASLEQRLVALPAAPVAPRKSARSSRQTFSHNATPAALAPKWIPKPHRWSSMHSALAVLAAMLVASLLVLYQVVPGPSEPPPIPAAVIAKPTIEPIAQFEFVPPMWGMPDATEWTYMEMSMFSIAPATSFTTDWPWYVAVDGPLTLTVLSGELSVTPAGPAHFYPANRSGQPPVALRAGETVSIGLNDTIVYSSADTGTGSNSGSTSAIVLNAVVGKLDKMLPGNSVRPKDVSFIAHEYDNAFSPTISSAGATVTLQRLELAPFDTFVFDPDEDLRYLPFIDPT